MLCGKPGSNRQRQRVIYARAGFGAGDFPCLNSRSAWWTQPSLGKKTTSSGMTTYPDSAFASSSQASAATLSSTDRRAVATLHHRLARCMDAIERTAGGEGSVGSRSCRRQPGRRAPARSQGSHGQGAVLRRLHSSCARVRPPLPEEPLTVAMPPAASRRCGRTSWSRSAEWRHRG